MTAKPSWVAVDETAIKSNGEWSWLYAAIDIDTKWILDVDPVGLVDAYELPAGTNYDPHGAVTLVYRCEAVAGELELSHEGEALAWKAIDDVEDWFFDHERYARDALDATHCDASGTVR